MPIHRPMLRKLDRECPASGGLCSVRLAWRAQQAQNSRHSAAPLLPPMISMPDSWNAVAHCSPVWSDSCAGGRCRTQGGDEVQCALPQALKRAPMDAQAARCKAAAVAHGEGDVVAELGLVVAAAPLAHPATANQDRSGSGRAGSMASVAKQALLCIHATKRKAARSPAPLHAHQVPSPLSCSFLLHCRLPSTLLVQAG